MATARNILSALILGDGVAVAGSAGAGPVGRSAKQTALTGAPSTRRLKSSTIRRTSMPTSAPIRSYAMKVIASLALAAACVVASPAFAGPQGTGLTFTEEVAKKAAAKRKAEAAAADTQASADCASKTGKAEKKDKACRAS